MSFIGDVDPVYILIGLIVLILIALLIVNFVKSKESYTKVYSNSPKKYKGKIVLYYATWCGFCKKFMPEWMKFEDYVKSNFPSVKVEKVRCEDGMEAECSQKGINGFPTVIFYKHDNSSAQFDVKTAEERNFTNLCKFLETCDS